MNQFRGRIARWVELPAKPSRGDIECLCRFCLPDVPKRFHELLTNFALESEYPFAAMKHAITEARELLAAGGKKDELNEQFIKNAIGFALFTSNQVATTLPLPAPRARRGKRRAVPNAADSGPGIDQQGTSTADAPRVQETAISAPPRDFPNPVTRAQPALTY